MVTPVSLSPAYIVYGIGAHPLQRGSKLGCTFNIPLQNKIYQATPLPRIHITISSQNKSRMASEDCSAKQLLRTY